MTTCSITSLCKKMSEALLLYLFFKFHFIWYSEDRESVSQCDSDNRMMLGSETRQ